MQSPKFAVKLSLSTFLITISSSVFAIERIELEPGASIVQVHRSPPPGHCVPKGPVIGLTDRPRRILFGKKADVNEQARNAIRNNAFAKGADYVYLDPGSEMDNSGQAFDCRTIQAAKNDDNPPPSPANPCPDARNVSQRLRALKEIFDEGLINENDYETKKAEILETL